MNEVFGFVLFTALLGLCSLAVLVVAATHTKGRRDGQSPLRGVAWALTVVSALALLISLVFLQAFTSREDVAFVVGPPLWRWLRVSLRSDEHDGFRPAGRKSAKCGRSCSLPEWL